MFNIISETLLSFEVPLKISTGIKMDKTSGFRGFLLWTLFHTKRLVNMFHVKKAANKAIIIQRNFIPTLGNLNKILTFYVGAHTSIYSLLVA